MCGIIGHLGRGVGTTSARARQYVVDQFEDQKSRGISGFGVVEIRDDGSVGVLRATEPVKMMIDLYTSKTRHLFLHHRSPTSSKNTLDQTHPIEVEHEELRYKWLVMHNGTISNASELKKKHEDLGYVYLTTYKEKYSNYESEKFNDTESFAIEIARYLEGITKELACTGGFTFIAISTDKDNLVQKVYAGGNGYGGISLFQDTRSFCLASEEKYGEEVKKDEATVFTARYTGNPKTLAGFDLQKEVISLKQAPIKSPYDYREHEHKTYPNGMGFHHSRALAAGGRSLPKDSGALGGGKEADAADAEDIKFRSFGHIVNYAMRSQLGKVFNDSASATHSAVEGFKLVDFHKNITAGYPEKAEDIFNKYISEIAEWFDMYDTIEEVLEPVDTKVGMDPTVAEIMEAGQQVIRRRMSHIAGECLPLIKVVTYCECVLTLAYQYRMSLSNPDKGNDAIVASLPPKERAALSDEETDEQIERDVSEAFPGNKGRDDERITNAEFKEIKTPAEDMENEAGAKIEALASTAPEMEAEEIYRNAEDVIDTVRSAAELSFVTHLRKVCAIAVEEGLPLQIPFHIHTIKWELDKFAQRLSTVARIVRNAKDKEEQEVGGSILTG